MQLFAGDLLALRKDGFGAADLDGGVAVHGVDVRDSRRDDLLVVGLELFHVAAALRVADALTDDVLRGLGVDASEVLRVQRDLDDVAGLRGLLVFLRGVDKDVGVFVVDDVDHVLAKIDIELFLLGVDVAEDDVFAVIVSLLRNNEGVGDLLIEELYRDPLFRCHQLYGVKKLLIHNVALPFLWSSVIRKTRSRRVSRMRLLSC